MRICKLPYSLNPWRLLDDNDCEVCTMEPFEHPGCIRGNKPMQTMIPSPVCGATRKECEERTLQFLSRLMRKVVEQGKLLKAAQTGEIKHGE